MKTAIAAFFLILASLCGVRANPNNTCPVPGHLLFGDSLLERVIAAANQQRVLKIVVMGTGSSMLSGPLTGSDAYPARLEQSLKQMVPKLNVEVVSQAKPRQTADKMVKTIDKILLDEKPILVIWQSGTFDANQGVNPKEFLNSITEGVEKLQSRGVDIILMNMQYSPRMELMLAIEAYADNMRWVARERQVPLFDRLAIMRNWNDTNAIDLYAASKDGSIAKRLHDCIGRALAALIIDAGHLGTIEGKKSQ
jgi:hypothetical protein